MNKRLIFNSILSGSSRWMNYSYSQEGEDIILDNLLEGKSKGFYIDIGAYHPFRFSNTMRFYGRGWHGLNIDATPGSMKTFNKYRPRDINVEAAISDEGGKLAYYIFEEGALNTFDADSLERLKEHGYIPLNKIFVETYSIMDILDKYLKEDQEIDFMDIDIEKFDEKVISRMDFSRYKPTIIMIENLVENEWGGNK